MLPKTHRALHALIMLSALAALCAFSSAQAQEIQAIQPRVYASLVMAPQAESPAPLASQSDDWLGQVNFYRALAGVPPVTGDGALSDNCLQHARYMAENNLLTHSQDPSKPYASPAGQMCASKGNAWIGQGTAWAVADSMSGWMRSVGHRLWLIYPTTPTFGYGFYTAASREAAALDVLTRANFGADTSYAGWPVRYPAASMTGVPAERYPITLMWRYFGDAPQITATSLRTEAGAPIAHSADTSLPAGHKGIQIVPSAALPDNTVFIVEVSGTYAGAPFSYSWRFSTGDTSLSGKSDAETAAADPPTP